MLLESAEHHAEAVRATPEGFGGEARALLTLGSELTEHLETAARGQATVRRRTANLFIEHGLVGVVTPTTPVVAPPRDAAHVELAGRRVPVSVALTRFTAWASAAGLPAISVPVVGHGLPVGIQFMAPPAAEATCLALALVMEHTEPSR
jgi:Asp-tRNA(Asn)/Glu-tRNA(Gln) amidotransferase A subunit family amidase